MLLAKQFKIYWNCELFYGAIQNLEMLKLRQGSNFPGFIEARKTFEQAFGGSDTGSLN